MDKASKRVKRPKCPSLRTRVFTKVFIKRLPQPNHVRIVLANTSAPGIANLSMGAVYSWAHEYALRG